MTKTFYEAGETPSFRFVRETFIRLNQPIDICSRFECTTSVDLCREFLIGGDRVIVIEWRTTPQSQNDER